MQKRMSRHRSYVTCFVTPCFVTHSAAVISQIGVTTFKSNSVLRSTDTKCFLYLVSQKKGFFSLVLQKLVGTSKPNSITFFIFTSHSDFKTQSSQCIHQHELQPPLNISKQDKCTVWLHCRSLWYIQVA